MRGCKAGVWVPWHVHEGMLRAAERDAALLKETQ